MRTDTGIIWDVWRRGGPFIGETRAIGRMTVDIGYMLNPAFDQGIWDPKKLPVRWFQDLASSQSEEEVPNIRTIDTDQSIDSDAATCSVVLSNQWMNRDDGSLGANDPFILARPDQRDPRVLGEPGFFSWNHGASAEARARWGQTKTAWWNILVPNALLRTYQGYGGALPMTIPAAVAAGYLALTGLWLVDDVTVGTNGEITLKCRDMAKLLIEQQLYPPLVPTSVYPLRYCRFSYRPEQPVIDTPIAAGERPLAYDTCANLAWYPPDGALHGHNPADAFDGNQDSFYLSVGNSGPEEPYAVEWIQATCDAFIDTVWVSPWAGNFTCYVSVMVDGAWVDGGLGNIPYNEAGIGRYNGAYEARIPYVTKSAVPWEAPVSIKLPTHYRAQKVRFTFTNLAHSQWGPYPFRAGARELHASMSTDAVDRVTGPTQIVRSDGNYRDFADIIKDLLLWSGWWLASTAPFPATPDILGNIESTGSYSEDCFPDDAFDKRPVIDAITTVKEVVGYIFWVDEDGGARFESPNWWSPGNFLTSGEHTDYIPEIDEALQLTAYSVTFADASSRSEIIVGTADPYKGIPGSLVTRFVPPTAKVLRGMVKPAMWINAVVTSEKEQRTMAELLAMHIYFRQRIGSVTCSANPLIQINDQVRIYERMTGETFIHYVRGRATKYDAETGTYTMTLTTHWLGDSDRWALR